MDAILSQVNKYQIALNLPIGIELKVKLCRVMSLQSIY